MVEEELIFNTQWTIQPPDFAGKIACAQDIQIQGLSEGMRNELNFYNFQNKTFSVDMENQNIGRIAGTGICDESVVGWEFRNNDLNFEGFETYTLQPDGSYLMKGEYVTSDQFRTQIEAHIWFKTKEVPPSTDFSKENENEQENGEEEP